MSIEITRDLINVSELKGSREVQALVETEVYLNTNKQEIESILWVEGRTEILNTKIIKDKLLVNGKIKFSLVYKAMEDGNLYTLDTTKDYREEIEIEGIAEGMESHIKSNIEYIEHELEENRIDLKALINFSSLVEENRGIEIIKEIDGKEDLQIREETIRYREVYGRDVSYANLKEEIRLDDNKPPIDKVIRFSIEVRQLQTLVADDRIILSAEAIVTLIYQGNNQIAYIKESLPFNHFIDIPGVVKDSFAQIDLQVVEGIYEIGEDELGELRLVDLEINIKADGRVYDHRVRPLVVDIYSTKGKINVEKEDLTIVENIDNFVHEEDLNVDIGIDVLEVLDIKEDFNIMDKKILEDSIIIEGILNVDVFYTDSNSGELRNFKDNFPYKSDLYYDKNLDGLEVDVVSSLGDPIYNINQDILSIDNKIKYDLNLNKEKTLQCIKDIGDSVEVSDKADEASISIYIVQKGDLLWDIAKRYNTTIDDILSSNNLDTSYEINVGDKIIIEKTIDNDFEAI